MSQTPPDNVTLDRSGQAEDQPVPEQGKQAVRNLRKLAGQAAIDGTIDQMQQVYGLLEENTRLLMDILSSLPEDYDLD